MKYNMSAREYSNENLDETENFPASQTYREGGYSFDFNNSYQPDAYNKGPISRQPYFPSSKNNYQKVYNE